MVLTVDNGLSSETPSACVAASDTGTSALSPPAEKIFKIINPQKGFINSDIIRAVSYSHADNYRKL